MTLLQDALERWFEIPAVGGRAQRLPGFGNKSRRMGGEGGLHRGMWEWPEENRRNSLCLHRWAQGPSQPSVHSQRSRQMASSAERHGAVKTRSGGKIGDGDTGLGEPASTRKPQWWEWVRLPRKKLKMDAAGTPGTRRQETWKGQGPKT